MRGFTKQRSEGGTFTAYWESRDPATGLRRQHSKAGFKTKGEAQKHLNVIVGKVTTGDWKPDQAITVKQLFEDYWLPAQRSRNLRSSTLSQYDNVIRAWIVPNIGGLRTAAVTPAHVQNLVEKLGTTKTSGKRAGLSPRSLQLVVGTLKAGFAFGLQQNLLGRNPIASVRRPQVQERPPTTWTDEQARAFLISQREDRLATLWALALTRGLRRGELAGLRWDAVDIDAGLLRIVHTLVVVDGHVEESTPKTKAGRREVPLDPSLISRLIAHRKTQAADRLKAGEAWRASGYVFTNELGERLSPDWISGRFVDLLKATKLPKIRLHDTRHTAASLMLASGVQPKVVQEMLGHSHVAITLSIYGHVTPSMGREAGAALSATLLG